MKKQEGESQIKHDLGWGNPYFLLELLDFIYGKQMNLTDISKMSYAPDTGKEELIELTREAIYKSSGIKYDYIIITAGATQGINSILKYRKHQRGYQTVITPEYGYPFYEDMLDNLEMQRIKLPLPFDSVIKEEMWSPPMWLIDSPSNPLGLQFKGDSTKAGLTVWDGVYHNNIYTQDLLTYPPHIAMVGSYSKLLGLTGARIGWIATQDLFFYERVKDVSLKDNATVSIPSQDLLIDILKNIDLEFFISQGKHRLNYNREEFQKIEYLFDNQPVQEVGIFYCVNANVKSREILDKAGVGYVELDGNMIRLSMGQTLDVTKSAVRDILKKDRI